MDFDTFLDENGQFGVFQIGVFFMLSFSLIFSSWQCYLHAFLGFIPPHRCWIEGLDNDTTHFKESWLNTSLPGQRLEEDKWTADSCKIFRANDTNQITRCDHWKHDTTTLASMPVTEWQLFCDQEWLISVAGSVNMAGGFVGFPFCGMASDRFGRKIVLLFSLCLTAVCGTGAAFSTNIYVFMVFRFFVELGESSLHYVLFVLVVELSGIQRRVKVACTFSILYSLGIISLSGIVQVLRNWRILQLTTSAPAVLLAIAYIWLIPESPRWLLTANRNEEAEEIMLKIQKWNNESIKNGIIANGPKNGYSHKPVKHSSNGIGKHFVKTFLIFHIVPIIVPTLLQPLTLELNTTSSTLLNPKPERCRVFWRFRMLFKTRTLALRTIVIAANRLLNGIIYMGLTLNAVNLQETDGILSFFLNGVAEILAYLLCFVTLDSFGRRISIIVAFFSTALSSLAVVLVSGLNLDLWIHIAIGCLTKFGSSFVNGAMSIYMVELFATELRATGIGFTTFFSTLSSVIVPFFVLSAKHNPHLPFLVYGLCATIGGLLTFSLPETRNSKLPDTIDE